MSEVYLAHPDNGEPIATDESILRTLWKQGFLSGDLLFWRSDLSDWILLDDHFEATNRSAPQMLNSPVRSLTPNPETPITRRHKRSGRTPGTFHPRHPRWHHFRKQVFDIDF